MTNTRKSLKERIGIWGVGYTANFLLVHVFDYALYPWVMWKAGLVKGAAIMWVLSFINCYLTMKFYDWSRTDWLGLETLKEVRDSDEKQGFFHKVMRWAMRRGDWMVMLVLSVKFDPFICTVYMRHGAHQYNGMTARDWKIFLTSFVIANAWWTTAVFTGLEVGEWVLQNLSVWTLLILIAVGLFIALLPRIVKSIREFWAGFSEAPGSLKTMLVVQVVLLVLLALHVLFRFFCSPHPLSFYSS